VTEALGIAGHPTTLAVIGKEGVFSRMDRENPDQIVISDAEQAGYGNPAPLSGEDHVSKSRVC